VQTSTKASTKSDPDSIMDFWQIKATALVLLNRSATPVLIITAGFRWLHVIIYQRLLKATEG